MSISKKIALGLFAAVVSFSSVSAQAATCTNYTFGAGLYKPFMSAPGVMEVQKFMNANGFTVATTGAGSAGFETSTYGTKTALAVKAFQTAKGVTPASGFFGNLTRTAALAHQTANCAGTNPGTNPGTVPQTGPVTVALATTNPAANYIYGGQATARLLDVTFNGTGTVSSVMLKRSGFSNQSTLTNVYLYDGVNRLTDGYTFNSNGDITINNVALMVNGSKTISVVADVEATGTSGQTVSVALSGFTLAGATTPTTVSVQGNMMSVASSSGVLATIGKDGTGTATGASGGNTVGDASINAGTSAYPIWRQAFQVNTRTLSLKAANFRVTGSAANDALANVKLFVDGVAAGPMATMANRNGSNYLSFDFSAMPISLNTGTHTFEVRADVVKGSGDTVKISLQQASDLMVMDSQVGVNLAVAGTVSGTGTFSASSAGTITILAGTATMTKDPSFNSVTNVTGGASNTVLTKLKIHGYGEDVKVYSVTVTPTLTGVTGANGLDDVTLYFNGSQVATQLDLASGTTGALVFNLGSQMIIPAGTDSMLEVRANLRSPAGVNYTDGSVVVAVAISAGNMEGMSSHSAPASGLSATGNSLSIQTGALGVSKNTSYASQTVSPNTAAQKIGSYTFQNNTSSESIRVTGLTVGLTTSTGAVYTTAPNNFAPFTTNFSGLYTSENPSYKIQPQATNVFSVDFTLASGATKTIDIFADTNSAVGVDVKTTLQASYMGVLSNVSGVAPALALDGQVITLNAGTLTNPPTFLASNSTNAQYVASPNGKTDASKATYTFNSTNGPSTITELKFTVTGTDTVSAVKVGNVTAPVVSSVAWLQGLNIAVANGGTGTNVDAMVSYTTVGTSGTASVTSNTTSLVSLSYVKYTAGGATTTLCAAGCTAVLAPVAANTMTLTAAAPTVKKTSSPVNVGTGSTSNVKVGTVMITANDGDIKIGTVPVSIGVPTGGTASNWTVKVNGTAPSGITQPTTNTSGFSFASGYQIQSGSSVSFDIFVDFAGVTTAGNADITLGSAGSFKWSDIVDGTTTNSTMTKTGTLLSTYNQ